MLIPSSYCLDHTWRNTFRIENVYLLAAIDAVWALHAPRIRRFVFDDMTIDYVLYAYKLDYIP